jgi:hypothetical protein
MATLTVPYDNFQNGGPIVAAEHNANNAAIENFVNGLSAGSNFDSGAIGSAAIASGAITSAKIQSSVSLTTPILGVATATSIAVSGNVVYHLDINQQVASYTLVLADDGKLVELNSASGINLTVPPYSSVPFPVGTQITIVQTGAGQVTVVQGSGVTVNSNPGLKIRAQYTAATLIKRGTDTWVLVGDLSS